MYRQEFLKIRFLIGLGAALVFMLVSFLIFTFAPFVSLNLIGPSTFHRNLVSAYFSFFVPLNIISWLSLGPAGGIAVFLFSCLLVLFFVLHYGILYYNLYIFLFWAATAIGYRFFLREKKLRNQCMARLETFEAQKNVIITGMSEKETETEVAEKRVQRYAALKDITERLDSALDLDKTAALIVKEAFTIVGKSNRAFLFILNENLQELGLLGYKSDRLRGIQSGKKPEIFESWILKQRRPLIIEDLDNDFRFSVKALTDPQDAEFKSVIASPLISQQKVLGVIRLDSLNKTAYTQDDLRLLNIIASLSAAAIENSVLYRETNELAIKDGLTGLYVQRYFKEKLEEEVKNAAFKRGSFSLLMVDLDHFKEANDKYGHAGGDIILVKIAEILRASAGIESHNIVSRYGGEEFTIFLGDTGKKEAVGLAENIRRKIESRTLVIRRHEVKITVSIGVSSFPQDGHLAEDLLKKADENLYTAKGEGRNRVCPSTI
ncbi:MAG: diguanylate cyclase [Candidatus Omnitrophica bacterium]|nr:diguanylate cyclase [Candidatus Omnitrophota bacterium]